MTEPAAGTRPAGDAGPVDVVAGEQLIDEAPHVPGQDAGHLGRQGHAETEVGFGPGHGLLVVCVGQGGDLDHLEPGTGSAGARADPCIGLRGSTRLLAGGDTWHPMRRRFDAAGRLAHRWSGKDGSMAESLAQRASRAHHRAERADARAEAAELRLAGCVDQRATATDGAADVLDRQIEYLDRAAKLQRASAATHRALASSLGYNPN